MDGAPSAPRTNRRASPRQCASAPRNGTLESPSRLALPRPAPPRFELDTAGAAILGRPEAPIVVTVFVDFASTHVRALQPVLTRLQDRYGESLALAFRQLPLPYHRFAVHAARAARCAHEQGRYRDYADAVFRVGPGFLPEDLTREADRIGLDVADFGRCRGASRASAEVDADLALAAELGVHRAPTVFVNGIYLTGKPGFDAIDAVVRSEFARLGEAVPAPGGSSGLEKGGLPQARRIRRSRDPAGGALGAGARPLASSK